MAKSRQYNVHGVELRVESEFPRVISELDKDFSPHPSKNLPPAGFVYVKREADIPSLIPEYAVVERMKYSQTVFSHEGKKFIAGRNNDYVLVIPSPSEKKIFCYAKGYSHRLFFTLRGFLKCMLTALLEDDGIYSAHGAAVSYEGRAAVMCGKSNFGKTRSLLSLCKHGFKLVTDDLVLFRGAEHSLLPLSMRGNVDEGHVEVFPELEAVLPKRKEGSNNEALHLVRLADLFKMEGEEVKPAVLVNIVRWNTSKSVFRDIGKDKMLGGLMACYRDFGSGAYFGSNKTMTDVFDFYSDLIEHVRTVDFFAGSDPQLFAAEFWKLFE